MLRAGVSLIASDTKSVLLPSPSPAIANPLAIPSRTSVQNQPLLKSQASRVNHLRDPSLKDGHRRQVLGRTGQTAQHYQPKAISQISPFRMNLGITSRQNLAIDFSVVNVKSSVVWCQRSVRIVGRVFSVAQFKDVQLKAYLWYIFQSTAESVGSLVGQSLGSLHLCESSVSSGQLITSIAASP